MPIAEREFQPYLDDINRLARGRVKLAELGGQPDAPFEQVFSNLAHAYLKSKAPSLLDFEVGFQLIDRNQDDTKAIGVAGFKVGHQWLYVPVFFLVGKLKGHELLYLKNDDLFVPLNEGWVNRVLNRHPNVLGKSVDRNLQTLGVMPPHLYQLSRSPHKFAAALDEAESLMSNMSPWVKEVMPRLAYFATVNPARDPKYANMIDLPTFLKKEGRAMVKALVGTFEQNAKLAMLVDELHGLHMIDEVIEELNKQAAEEASNSVLKPPGAKCIQTTDGVRCYNRAARKPQKNVLEDLQSDATQPGDPTKTAEVDETKHLTSAAAAGEKRPVQLFTYDEVMTSGTGLKNLTDKDREKLIKDKVVIKDDREDSSIAYEMQSPIRLQNPTETGLFDVLVRENKFEKCLIILAPYDHRGRKDFVTVVKLAGSDNGYSWINTHSANIWTGYQYPNKDFQDWVDGLSKVDSLSASRTGLHVLINNAYEGSVPFTVDKEIGAGDRKTYDVYFKSHCEGGRPYHLPPLRHGGEGQQYYDRSLMMGDGGCRIVLTGKRGRGMRSTGSDLYVPTDFRKLTLRPEKDDDEGLMGMCGCGAHSDPPPIQPGNQFDIELLLGTKTAEMKIYSSSGEVEINGKRMAKLGGLIHLVRDHGLREKQARVLLKRAEKDRTTRCRVVYANGYSAEKAAAQSYDMQQTAPGSPNFPEPNIGFDPMTGNQIPTMQMSEYNLKVPDMSAFNTDRSIYYPMGPDPKFQQPMPDRAAQQAAIQAGQMGQKEVFDTSMIAGMLKAVKDDSMIDRHMGDIIKGLDRLGRILLSFYWHGEQFQERYGKSEMVELEDGLRNAFEALGDIILFLEQRQIHPDPDNASYMDLKGIAEQ